MRIVEFAGVEKFLDTPVKRYSIGCMCARPFRSPLTWIRRYLWWTRSWLSAMLNSEEMPWKDAGRFHQAGTNDPVCKPQHGRCESLATRLSCLLMVVVRPAGERLSWFSVPDTIGRLLRCHSAIEGIVPASGRGRLSRCRVENSLVRMCRPFDAGWTVLHLAIDNHKTEDLRKLSNFRWDHQ